MEYLLRYKTAGIHTSNLSHYPDLILKKAKTNKLY